MLNNYNFTTLSNDEIIANSTFTPASPLILSSNQIDNMLNTRSRNTRNYLNSLRVLAQNMRVNSNESSDRLNINGSSRFNVSEGGFFNIPDLSFGPPMRPVDFMHESFVVPIIKFKKILTPYESEEEFKCPLTLESHKTGFILPCKHIFSDEILNWNKKTCPCCRAEY